MQARNHEQPILDCSRTVLRILSCSLVSEERGSSGSTQQLMGHGEELRANLESQSISPQVQGLQHKGHNREAQRDLQEEARKSGEEVARLKAQHKLQRLEDQGIRRKLEEEIRLGREENLGRGYEDCVQTSQEERVLESFSPYVQGIEIYNTLKKRHVRALHAYPRYNNDFRKQSHLSLQRCQSIFM